MFPSYKSIILCCNTQCVSWQLAFNISQQMYSCAVSIFVVTDVTVRCFVFPHYLFYFPSPCGAGQIPQNIIDCVLSHSCLCTSLPYNGNFNTTLTSKHIIYHTLIGLCQYPCEYHCMSIAETVPLASKMPAMEAAVSLQC